MNRTMMSKLFMTIAIISLMVCSVFAFVACDNNKDSEPKLPEVSEDGTIDTSNHILPEDGTYKITGMRDRMPFPKFMEDKKLNFGDELIIEKTNGLYYVTIEIVKNDSVERLYWKDRKEQMTTDAVIVKDGLDTKYTFAFTDEAVREKLKFKIGGGKMPLDPDFGFKIDFDDAVKISDEVADVERPEPFI